MKKIPYGISNYEELIEKGCYYVDKTGYLSSLETRADKILYLRPRRFGKTLFTSMMFYYYDLKSSDKFDKLFKDTKVYKEPTDNKNNYYVLKFDFSGMAINKENIDDIEKQFIKKVVLGIDKFIDYYGLNIDMDYQGHANQIILDFLSKFETLFLDKKIYLIIDEYDKFTNAILEGDAETFQTILGKNGFVRAFYEPLKEYSGAVIDRIFITGVCSISVDAMTSGFNVATNITNEKEFNAMTALTHEEVKALISEIDSIKQETIFDTMIKNYDGYKFNNKAEEKVFNPTLVMYYLSNYYRLGEEPEELFDKNIISSYIQIKNVITLKNNQVYKPVLKELLDTKATSGILMGNFDMIKDVDDNIITSLLYYFGYITIDGIFDSSINSYKYAIPNKAIDRIFNDYLVAILKEDNIYFDNKIVMECEREMISEGKIDKLSKYIEEVLKSGGNRLLEKFDEKYVQLLYYAILSPRNTYNTYMEYPSNERYIDLILFKNRSDVKYDILVEFKYIKKKEYSNRKLKKKKKDALEQIEEYMKDKRINKKSLRKYIIIFVGNELKVLEEV